MAKIAKRRGRWVTDAYIHGRRVVKSYGTKREAEDALSKLNTERRQASRPAIDPFVTVAGYAARFMATCREQEVADATLDHILPRLGTRRVRDLTRSDLRTFVLALVAGGMKRSSAKQVRSVISNMLNLAMDEEVIAMNPALGLMREKRTKKAKQRAKAAVTEVKAMTSAERNRFLAVAATRDPETFVAFMLMALAGLRIGEALGLRCKAVGPSSIHVTEQVWNDSTKTGEARRVDLAAPLAALLADVVLRRREQAFSAGRDAEEMFVVYPDLSPRPSKQEAQAATKRVSRQMRTILKRAELASHFTPHALRHTFCSLLIAAGVSPVYVQQQAGHADLRMTVNTYGSWFPMQAPGAMDRLADGVPTATGSRNAETGNSRPATPLISQRLAASRPTPA
jgi:integrase